MYISENTFQATLIQSPSDAKLSQRPVRIFVTSKRLSLVAHIPPVIQISWLLSDIRSFGVVAAGTFCIEGGSRAGKGMYQDSLCIYPGFQEMTYCFVW